MGLIQTWILVGLAINIDTLSPTYAYSRWSRAASLMRYFTLIGILHLVSYLFNFVKEKEKKKRKKQRLS